MTRRSWTAQDQITAEVAAACGVNLAQIGKALEANRTCVEYHLECGKVRTAKLDRQNARRRGRRSLSDKGREAKRRWYNLNREKCRDQNKYYRSKNKEKISERRRLDKVRRRAFGHLSLTPITLAAKNTRFALWRNRCAFCGVDAKHPRNAGHDRLTVEHVLALTKNGLDEADNIAPACHSCNCSKNNAPVEEWYRRQPFFTEARWRKICRHCPAAVVGQLPLAFGPADEEAP